MLSLISAAALSFTPAVTPASDGWYADFDEAVAVAREEGKDLFVDFTGSDWCGWCIKKYCEWDNTHNDIEVYDRNGRHPGSMHPDTGEMYKPAVAGRTIDV